MVEKQSVARNFHHNIQSKTLEQSFNWTIIPLSLVQLMKLHLEVPNKLY